MRPSSSRLCGHLKTSWHAPSNCKERERERASSHLISPSEQAPQELNPVLPSCAALRVSLDPSGRADVSRGKHGVAPNRQWQISHTALCGFQQAVLLSITWIETEKTINNHVNNNIITIKTKCRERKKTGLDAKRVVMIPTFDNQEMLWFLNFTTTKKMNNVLLKQTYLHNCSCIWDMILNKYFYSARMHWIDQKWQ